MAPAPQRGATTQLRRRTGVGLLQTLNSILIPDYFDGVALCFSRRHELECCFVSEVFEKLAGEPIDIHCLDVVGVEVVGCFCRFRAEFDAESAEVSENYAVSSEELLFEAGYCVGMSYTQIMRRIVLPQALRTAFPPLSNSLISMVKDTSLASNITVAEMFMATQRINARYYEPLALYLEVAVIYLIFCTLLTWLQRLGEKKLSAYTKKEARHA